MKVTGIDLLPNGGINPSATIIDDEYNHYYFDLMLGIQDGFLFPLKIEDGKAYFLREGDGWIEDEIFPWEEYNKYITLKLEEELQD